MVGSEWNLGGRGCRGDGGEMDGGCGTRLGWGGEQLG